MYHEDFRELESANHSRKQEGAVTGPEVTIMFEPVEVTVIC